MFFLFFSYFGPEAGNLFCSWPRGLKARKNSINIKILGGTVFGTNRNRACDKRDLPPVPGINREFHSKIGILSL